MKRALESTQDEPLKKPRVDHWVPVVVKHFGPTFEESVRDKYEVNDRCQFRNKLTGHILKHLKYKRVKLYTKELKKDISIYQLCINSFKPSELPADIEDYNTGYFSGKQDDKPGGDQWVSVVVKHHGQEFEELVKQRYEINRRCQIRNRETMHFMTPSEKHSVTLGKKNAGKQIAIYKICLETFGPDDLPDNINDFNTGYHEEQPKSDNWVPVVVRHFGPEYEEMVKNMYEVNDHSQIRSIDDKHILSPTNRDRVSLCPKPNDRMIATYRACLASFKPDELPENVTDYDCDHIDGDHSNNTLENLQWLLKDEHTRKTMRQTKHKRKSKVEKTSKPIWVVDVKGSGNREYMWKHFQSNVEAGVFFNKSPKSISAAVRGKYYMDKKYKLEYFPEQDLPGEIWKPFHQYQVSNLGRIKTKRGNVTIGTESEFDIYRTFGVTLPNQKRNRKMYVHHMVWIAHHGPIPDGMVVMHDDTKSTRDANGRERNYLYDLSLGTQKENMKSYHANKTKV